MFECQNCKKLLREVDLVELREKGILERVLAGEIMPWGECPDCRALVHKVEPQELAADLAYHLEQKVPALCLGSHEECQIAAEVVFRWLEYHGHIKTW